MKGEINDVKYIVTEKLEANKSLPLPLGITEGVKYAFQCKIMHETPIKPAIVKTKCCSSLLWCEECVNIWYDGVHGLNLVVLVIMSPGDMHSASNSKDLMISSQESETFWDLRKMINFRNEIQIKYNTASFQGWVSLCHQRSKQLNTQILWWLANYIMMTMCWFVIGCGLF